MNIYFLFIVFLSIGECNARVVPLDFKIDKSKHVDSNFLENEVFDESPPHEVEILGLGLPDVEQSNDSNLSNSEKNNTTVLEISNRNASNLSIDLTFRGNDGGEESKLESAESSEVSDVPHEEFKSVSEFIKKDVGEESGLDSAESSELSDASDEEFKSVSEFTSKNNLDFKDSFETLQVNENLNNKTSDFLTFKNETSIANNSSHDLEQETDFRKIEDKILNAFNQEETIAASEIINGNQNGTIAASEIINGNQNGTTAASEIINGNQNETIVAPHVISDLNKTFAVSDVINSDQNKTFVVFEIVNGTNSSNNLSEVQSLSDDSKVEVFLSDAKTITENFKSEELASENLELSNDSAKAAGGILSGFGFLINSEVARNAAKAMEVFNFSDALTDHIIEENEFHSFLPAFNAEQGVDSSNQADSKTAIIINSSGDSNETRSGFNTSLAFENATSVVLNKTELEEIKRNSFIPINSSDILAVRNKTELSDLGEKSEGNAALEAASPLENSKEKIQLASEATPSKQINVSVDVPSTIGFPECPPPGWCIFWFLSQDTCAVNEHCLGSRICCKIRCSKTCIEVELP